MTPALLVLSSWFLFGGSHLLLSSSGLREQSASRLGPQGFTLLFSAVTFVTMSVLIITVWIYGDQGLAGPNLDQNAIAFWGFGAIGFCGAILAVAGLINYPRSPMAVLAKRQRREFLSRDPLHRPTNVERVSRHPFFAGLAILMSVHALFANTLSGTIYFGGFVIIALVGIPLQDRKLRARWSTVYSDFERQTSAIPFGTSNSMPAAADAGHAQWVVWTVAVIVTVVLLGVLHPVWAYANGALFAVFILLFGLIGVLAALLANKRSR